MQVNGKVRDRVQAPGGRGRTSSSRWRRAGRRNVRAHVDGKQVVKEIVVPGRLVNVVVK